MGVYSNWIQIPQRIELEIYYSDYRVKDALGTTVGLGRNENITLNLVEKKRQHCHIFGVGLFPKQGDLLSNPVIRVS